MNEYEHSLRNLMRESERQLSPDITERLAESRRLAVSRARLSRWPRFLVPSLAMAAASVVAVVLVWSPLDGRHSTLPLDSSLSQENTEFYEDLDFYYWLAEQDVNQRG